MVLHSLKEVFEIVPNAFGLDISDSSFKFLQLSKKKGNFSVEVYGEQKLREGIVERGFIKQSKKLSIILQEALSRHISKGLSKYVVISLPDEEVFLKLIRLPLMDFREAESAVQVEVENSIPIKLDDAYLDYNKVDLQKKNNN